MSVRSDTLLWAQRVISRKGASAHQILEIAADAGVDVAQEAFHKIARTAHPDLHRTTLLADELELVTTAYARAAAAYQEIRQKLTTGRHRPLREPSGDPVLPTTTAIPTSASPHQAVAVAPATSPSKPASGSSPPQNRPAVPRSSASIRVLTMPDKPPLMASREMSSKALIHYRKAELCLRSGDLGTAVLQLKMAIATDPQSVFLRTALAEVEVEVRKKP